MLNILSYYNINILSSVKEGYCCPVAICYISMVYKVTDKPFRAGYDLLFLIVIMKMYVICHYNKQIQYNILPANILPP